MKKNLFRLMALAAACAASAAPARAQAPTPAPAEASVAVQSIRVVGNTLLDEKLVYEALKLFRGQRTLEELRRAADAVQRLYAEAGYGGVVAFLPPQQGGEPGVVTIRVVEGKVSAVRVQGARFHSEENIRAALPDLKPGTTPRLRRIDSQIELANENPSKRTQVLLRPGAQVGDVAVDLTVLDRNPQTFSLSLDDTGNERTGKLRASAGWQHANISGNDDVASLQYQTSLTKPSQVSVVSGFYRYPLPAATVVIDAYAAYSDVDAGTGSTAAGNVRINGRGHLAGLRGTWLLPRWGEVDQRVSAAFDLRAYVNRCDLDGQSSAVCGAAGQDVTVTPLSLDYALRGTMPFTWSTTFTALTNLKLGGSKGSAEAFEAQRPGARRGYGQLRFVGNANADIFENWQLRTRVAAQWTRQAMVAGEQFGLGGAVSVRGYEERELVGDKGVVASLELGGPEMLSRKSPNEPSLRAFAFADGGMVANLLDAPCSTSSDRTRCSLASAGLGLSFERQRLQARLAAAVALKEGTLTRKNDTRAHFSASLSY